ncbi:MAG: hypothetical protein J6R47_05655 [Acholeplasmatales bacterium]|nr:hypothetical protein [Acholeplasmatales bacterium]
MKFPVKDIHSNIADELYYGDKNEMKRMRDRLRKDAHINGGSALGIYVVENEDHTYDIYESNPTLAFGRDSDPKLEFIEGDFTSWEDVVNYCRFMAHGAITYGDRRRDRRIDPRDEIIIYNNDKFQIALKQLIEDKINIRSYDAENHLLSLWKEDVKPSDILNKYHLDKKLPDKPDDYVFPSSFPQVHTDRWKHSRYSGGASYTDWSGDSAFDEYGEKYESLEQGMKFKINESLESNLIDKFFKDSSWIDEIRDRLQYLNQKDLEIEYNEDPIVKLIIDNAHEYNTEDNDYESIVRDFINFTEEFMFYINDEDKESFNELINENPFMKTFFEIYNREWSDWDKIEESLQDKVQYGVHQFSTESIIFRGTEEECIKYIDERPELWDDAEVYWMTPDDPHYQKNESLEEDMKYYPQDYDTIELEYNNLEFTQSGNKRDADDWDEWDRVVDWTYEVDKDDLYTFIFESCITKEDYPRSFEDDFDSNNEEDWKDFTDWLDDNFDEIFNKYEDKIMDNYEEEAVEDALENYDPDDYIDWDSMPGGHDDYKFDESIKGDNMKFKINEASYADNFGLVAQITDSRYHNHRYITSDFRLTANPDSAKKFANYKPDVEDFIELFFDKVDLPDDIDYTSAILTVAEARSQYEEDKNKAKNRIPKKSDNIIRVKGNNGKVYEYTRIPRQIHSELKKKGFKRDYLGFFTLTLSSGYSIYYNESSNRSWAKIMIIDPSGKYLRDTAEMCTTVDDIWDVINEYIQEYSNLNESKEEKICCICKKPYEGYGNNAEPVCSGRCCDKCNIERIIPMRFKMLNEDIQEPVRTWLLITDSKDAVTVSYRKRTKDFAINTTNPNWVIGDCRLRFLTEEDAIRFAEFFIAQRGASSCKVSPSRTLREVVKIEKASVYDVPCPADIPLYVSTNYLEYKGIDKDILMNQPLNEGNPVSGKIPESIDSFLQDIAQMYQTIDYGDIMDHDYTEDDIKALRSLRRKFREEAQYEGSEEAEAAMNDIAEKVAVILKAKNESKELNESYSASDIQIVKEFIKDKEQLMDDILDSSSRKELVEYLTEFIDELLRELLVKISRDGFKKFLKDLAKIGIPFALARPEDVTALHNYIDSDTLNASYRKWIQAHPAMMKEAKAWLIDALESHLNESNKMNESLNEEMISDYVLIGFNHFSPEDLIVIHGSKEDLETINDDRVDYSEIIPMTDKLLWIENNDEYLRVSNTNFNSIDEFRNAVEAEMQKNIDAGNYEFEILHLTSFYIDEDLEGLSAQELTDKFMDWIDESYVDNDSNSAIQLIKGNELDDQFISYTSVEEFLESLEDQEDWDDDTDFDIEESAEYNFMEALYKGSDFDKHDDELLNEDFGDDSDYVTFYYSEDRKLYIGSGDIVTGSGKTLKAAVEACKADAENYDSSIYSDVEFDESNIDWDEEDLEELGYMDVTWVENDDDYDEDDDFDESLNEAKEPSNSVKLKGTFPELGSLTRKEQKQFNKWKKKKAKKEKDASLNTKDNASKIDNQNLEVDDEPGDLWSTLVKEEPALKDI